MLKSLLMLSRTMQEQSEDLIGKHKNDTNDDYDSPVSEVSERRPGRGRGTMCRSIGSVESKDMQLAGDFAPVKRGREGMKRGRKGSEEEEREEEREEGMEGRGEKWREYK